MLHIITKAQELSEKLNFLRDNGSKIGFVPTMGALHDGHKALIDTSIKDGQFTVVSIFVNPTQFNNAEDFKHYPNTLLSDLNLLNTAGVGILFLPEVDEIYPHGLAKEHSNLGSIDKVFEGKYRPGHFSGVYTIVNKLLTIVGASTLYLGQKDLQQVAVIQKLVAKHFKRTVSISIVETIRNSDGVALSSRNLRLSQTALLTAACIPKVLTETAGQLYTTSEALDLALEKGRSILTSNGVAVEYLDFVYFPDFDLVSQNISKQSEQFLIFAGYLESVRLIDNTKVIA